MNHTFHMQRILNLLLIAALCLAGGFPSAPASAVPPQTAKARGQAEANAAYKGPGFVLVKVYHEPLSVPANYTGKSTDQQGNLYTTRYESDIHEGESSLTSSYREVQTKVEKATGNSRVMRSIEREGGVSWTPPPAVVPPSFVYRPQPKFSGSAKGIGVSPPEAGGDLDLQIGSFCISLSWSPDPLRCLISLRYGPDGIKTDVNKPLVFPALKTIQAYQANGQVEYIGITIAATSATGIRQDVGYSYESRPEVTVASATTPPQEPPEPPEKPVAPTRAKTVPAPASVSTPEVTPKPPVPPVVPPPVAKPKPPVATTPPQKPSSVEQRFEVYNLGEATNVFQSADKPRGTLSIGGGKLKYQEAGKTVFSLGRAEVTEIDANSVLGYNTGTFHVILKSGKTYNFAPASLSVADGQKMLESIKHALP